ncbi:uncharacterized protein MONOS_10936 [Monocercomonoides exilis]|uniref:uncharacterized protein n=1 Tax=Monocercomonoides exilis TaxID=2049356 RepID=UPI00355A1154|nr:hypothetical protein MONOS_10936 [Monocercomonoides exilis]|eukprot:MONOS_10936.1-p1 / transcript=MONOS_10936.1 / gene=MONOS_10936 / organism=Monocercomonoides_exilis_PA203 / gene_product=unspecified product / transcript_product=unspecified product / location=Mono_scaffold00520:13448-14288(-) / protein_length=179 / sequence_SO=supercontig / SO=protein_coding / is_pseudo=false
MGVTNAFVFLGILLNNNWAERKMMKGFDENVVLSAIVCVCAGGVPEQRFLHTVRAASGWVSAGLKWRVEAVQQAEGKKKGRRVLFRMVRLLVELVELQLWRNEVEGVICFGLPLGYGQRVVQFHEVMVWKRECEGCDALPSSSSSLAKLVKVPSEKEMEINYMLLFFECDLGVIDFYF